MSESLADVLWPTQVVLPLHLRGIDATEHPWCIQPDVHYAHREWARHCASTCIECTDTHARVSHRTPPSIEPVCAGPLDHRVIVGRAHHVQGVDALARHHLPGQHYLALGARSTDTHIVGPVFATTNPPLLDAVDDTAENFVVPLFFGRRKTPNVNPQLIPVLEHYWKIKLQPHSIWAYTLAVLSDPNNREGIPLTADPDLARRGIRLGRLLAAIQCSYIDPGAARWTTPINASIQHPVSMHYDHATGTLQIGSHHTLVHIGPHVRNARIGSRPIIDRWVAGHAHPEHCDLELTPSESRARALRQCENLQRVVWRLQGWILLTAQSMQLSNQIYEAPLIVPFAGDDAPMTP